MNVCVLNAAIIKCISSLSVFYFHEDIFTFLFFSAIRRKENGWYDEERPLVFLFLGSSGIGICC